MNKEQKIMSVVSKGIKKLNPYTKTYAVDKGVRRFLFYKDISLSHFKLLVEDFTPIRDMIKRDNRGYYLETELGKLRLRKGVLSTYLKNQAFSLNSIALDEKGFIFSDSIDKAVYSKNINNREAAFVASSNDKNTMHEYCYLRYEGFTISNASSVLDLVMNMSNEDRMYGVKLALELKSYNIADSLNAFNIFSHMNPKVSSCDIKDFFMNCARNNYSIDEPITDKNKVTNSLIGLVYALERRDGFDGDKFDKAFNKYGVNVPSNIHEEVKRIFLNGKSDLIYESSCPSMNSNVKFIQHLVNRYLVMLGE